MKNTIVAISLFLASICSMFAQHSSDYECDGSTLTGIEACSTTKSLNTLIEKYPSSTSLRLINYPFNVTKDTLIYTMKHLSVVELINYTSSAVDSILWGFASLKTITNLLIIDCQLNQFPESLRNFTKLDFLLFKNVKFHIVPDLGNLSVDTLYVDKADISAFTPEFCKYSKLKELYILNQTTTVLPQGIENMNELKGMYVESSRQSAFDNILRRLPEDTKLERLHFNSSQLSYIPESIRKLSNLKELDLSANQKLSSLPGVFSHLKKLETLNIGVCGFTEFPKILFEIKTLKSVRIDGNNITDVGCTFENSPFKEISFFSNPLSEESLVLIENTMPEVTSITYPYEISSNFHGYPGDKIIERSSQITVLSSTPSLSELMIKRPKATAITFNNYSFDSKKDSLFFASSTISHVTFRNFSEANLNSILAMLSSQRSIRSIAIDDSLLTTFPLSLHYFTHLDYLQLKNVSLAASVHHPERSVLTIDTLSLISDSLVMFSPHFAKQLQIQCLYICNPRRAGFPGGFEGMSDLKVIGLCGFPATALESMVEQIPADNKIVDFGCVYSAIRAIPPSIATLKKVQRLRFQGDTLLSSLPPVITNLLHVNEVDISLCGFKVFPSELLSMKKLEVLNLWRNKITDLGCTFENTTIKLINLYDNPLSAESRMILKKTVPVTTRVIMSTGRRE